MAIVFSPPHFNRMADDDPITSSVLRQWQHDEEASRPLAYAAPSLECQGPFEGKHPVCGLHVYRLLLSYLFCSHLGIFLKPKVLVAFNTCLNYRMNFEWSTIIAKMSNITHHCFFCICHCLTFLVCSIPSLSRPSFQGVPSRRAALSIRLYNILFKTPPALTPFFLYCLIVSAIFGHQITEKPPLMERTFFFGGGVWLLLFCLLSNLL